LGSACLKQLDNTNATLIAQAEKIKAALADVPEITFAKIPAGYRHIFHQFVMHFDGASLGADRNALMDILTREFKIRCIVQYCPLYRFPLFQKMNLGQHDCPVLEAWWDNTFSFPWWCGIPDETIEYLTNAVRKAVARLKS